MLIRCECRFGIHFTYGDFQKIFDRRYCYRSAEGQQTALDYTNESTGKINTMFSLCFLSFQLPSAWFSLYLFRLSTHSSSTLNGSIRKRSTIRLHPIRLCVFSTLLFFALLSNNKKKKKFDLIFSIFAWNQGNSSQLESTQFTSKMNALGKSNVILLATLLLLLSLPLFFRASIF